MKYWEEGYGTAHVRLHRVRGSATAHECVDCGAMADEWSQVHDTDGNDVRNYEPRCRSCHRSYDWDNANPDRRQEHAERAASRTGWSHTEEARRKMAAKRATQVVTGRKCQPGCICKRHTNSGNWASTQTNRE